MASGKATPVSVVGNLSSLPLPSGPPGGGGAPSETQSEISSMDSDWSDIRAIAMKLGVQNPDDLHTERFKVDRQKLEQLIKGSCNLIHFLNWLKYVFRLIL